MVTKHCTAFVRCKLFHVLDFIFLFKTISSWLRNYYTLNLVSLSRRFSPFSLFLRHSTIIYSPCALSVHVLMRIKIHTVHRHKPWHTTASSFSYPFPLFLHKNNAATSPKCFTVTDDDDANKTMFVNCMHLGIKTMPLYCIVLQASVFYLFRPNFPW